MSSKAYFSFVTLTLGVVFLRLARPELMFFQVDQGLLFNSAESFARSGEWPTHGLVGTKGLSYGPIPLWILVGLRRLISDSAGFPGTVFYFNALFHVLTLSFLFAGMRRIFLVPTLLVVFGLILTSPHLLHYSRSVWDNPYLIGFSNIFAGILFFSLSKPRDLRSISPRGFLGLCTVVGLIAGLSLGTHLMAVPLVVMMFIFLWMIAPNKNFLLIGAALALAVCGIILLSYVRSQIAAQGVSRESIDVFAIVKRLPTGTRDILAQWSAWVSPAAFSRYYFDANYLEIWQRGFGISGVWSYVFTSIFLFQICWALAIVGIPAYLLSKSSSILETNKKVIVTIIAVGLAAHFSMSLIKDATTHPHYFQAMWWIPFVLVAIALDYLKSFCAKIYKMILGFIAVVVVCNFLFVSTLANRLNFYEGFEGSGFGPTVSAQKDMMKSLCARDTPSLIFRSESKVFFESNVRWWGGALEECKTKEFLFSSSEGIDFKFNFADRPFFTAKN